MVTVNSTLLSTLAGLAELAMMVEVWLARV